MCVGMEKKSKPVLVEEGDEFIPLTIAFDDQKLEVRGLNDRWYDKAADYFKIAASDGRLYLLRRDLNRGDWTIESVTELDS